VPLNDAWARSLLVLALCRRIAGLGSPAAMASIPRLDRRHPRLHLVSVATLSLIFNLLGLR